MSRNIADMRTLGRAGIAALVPMMVAACAQNRSSQWQGTPGVEGGAQNVPPGSEKAVAGAKAAYPDAVLDDVVTPCDTLGLGGPDDTIWTLHTRLGEAKQVLTVSGQGVVIHSRTDVATDALPEPVRSGAATAAPGGVASASRVETRGVVRYVAMASPEIDYRARVAGADGDVVVTFKADGTILNTRPAQKGEFDSEPGDAAPAQEAPIPPDADKAVAAMRQVFPGMVFDGVEEVPYVDEPTQTMQMLWYEVEFYLDGVKHEFSATPDGLVIAFYKPVPVATMSKAASDAVAAAVPGGRIRDLSRMETRGEPRFVELDTPVVVYLIRPVAAEGAEVADMRLMPDGTKAEELDLPDWAKKGEGGGEQEAGESEGSEK